jgi:hypothetical protein
MPARIIERTEAGFTAFVTDMYGARQAVGQYGDAAVALEAARSAFAGSAQ